MCSLEGIGKGNHTSFQKLANQDSQGRFTCAYRTQLPPVHSKSYTWLKGSKPVESFTGSANYSQMAFFNGYKECFSLDDPEEGEAYFKNLLKDSINCLDDNVENIIKIYDERNLLKKRQGLFKKETEDKQTFGSITPALEKQTISFLDNSGNLPTRSGLNWGKRPEHHRNPNQAYIRVPAKVKKANFFPPRGQHFTLITDDGDSFDCVIAQDNEKAIETPQNNALLGAYFRKRLNLKSGVLIKKEALVKYGRTSVDIYKIDPETYYLDFSKTK